MSRVLVTEQYLDDIADAIREKNGTETTYKPPQMAAAIEALPDPSVLESKSITANGTYDPSDDGVDGYDEVTVNVPNSYNAGDEGKVVSNGSLVAQTARSSNITDNGTYDTTLNNEVTVAVSGGGGGDAQLPKCIDSVFCGSSGADVSQSQTVSITNRNGKYGLLIVLHRLPITLSQSLSSDVAVQGVTPIDLNRADSVDGSQCISVYKILINSDQYTIYIRTSSSVRMAATVWVFDDDFALSYNRTEYSGAQVPFEKELHLTNASLIIAQSYYAATEGNYTIPLSSADAKLCGSIFPYAALRLFSALVMRPSQTTIIGAKRATSDGDAQPITIDRFFDLLIYDISLAE